MSGSVIRRGVRTSERSPLLVLIAASHAPAARKPLAAPSATRTRCSLCRAQVWCTGGANRGTRPRAPDRACRHPSRSGRAGEPGGYQGCGLHRPVPASPAIVAPARARLRIAAPQQSAPRAARGPDRCRHRDAGSRAARQTAWEPRDPYRAVRPGCVHGARRGPSAGCRGCPTSPGGNRAGCVAGAAPVPARKPECAAQGASREPALAPEP